MKNTNSKIINRSISSTAGTANHKRVLCIPIGICLLFAANAHALNWESGYGASITAGRDDNFLLAPTNEVDTSFSKLNLFASAEGNSELTSVEIRAGINNDNYSDASVDDRTTGNLSLSLSNQSERRQTNLGVNYLTEPTIETELLDTGVIVDGTRDTLTVSPGMSYQLDERNSLSINLGFTDVDYDKVPLTEYQDSSVSVSWGYRLDETSDFSSSLSISQYDPDNAATTDTTSLNLGYVMRPSETTTYSFSIGFSDVDGPGNTQDEDGSTYSVAINKVRDERNRFSLTAARSFQASGLGIVREEDRLDLSWTHGFSEKVQGVLSADFVSTDDRDYFEIQPSISYRMSENLSISGNYRFRKQDLTAGADAESNSFLITLSYQL